MSNIQKDLQEQTILEVTNLLKKYPSVVAAALTGSFVDNTNTAFSDIDLLVVFENDERAHLQDIFNDIVSIKPTLSTLYQLYDKESLVLYADGVRLDITLEKRSDFDKWILKPVKVLFDPGKILEQMVKRSAGIHSIPEKPKWNENEGVYVDWFFWMFRQAYCYVSQSDIVTNKAFEKRDLALSSIKSIRDKLLATLYYVNGKRDYLINIDENLLNKFTESQKTSTTEEMKNSIRILLDLYEVIIDKYCDKEKIKYPSQKVNQMKSLLNEFDEYTN